jgi:hypothetical protein
VALAALALFVIPGLLSLWQVARLYRLRGAVDRQTRWTVRGAIAANLFFLGLVALLWYAAVHPSDVPWSPAIGERPFTPRLIRLP